MPGINKSALTLEAIQAALALAPPIFDVEAAQRILAPSIRPPTRDPNLKGEARQAATMLLLYPYEETLHFVLTRRPDDLKHHGGQVSFPGGRQDDGETFWQTAQRETCEELGICEDIQAIGQLTRLYILPSDFEVTPFVGYLPQRPHWQPHPHEVAEVIECTLLQLLDEDSKGWDDADFNGLTFRYGFYHMAGHRVWGATAIMLSEFEQRLRHVLGS